MKLNFTNIHVRSETGLKFWPTDEFPRCVTEWPVLRFVCFVEERHVTQLRLVRFHPHDDVVTHRHNERSASAAASLSPAVGAV